METYNDIWNAVLEYCKGKVSETGYKLWLTTVEIGGFENNSFVLIMGSAVKKKIVMEQYGNLIEEALEQVLGFKINVEYRYKQSIFDEVEEEKKEEESNKILDNEQFTFKTFIEGPSNRFAYRAAIAVAENPGGMYKNDSSYLNYNPLFIYGKSGLGKTHILNAICYEIRRKFPEMRILYVRTEDFANEFINALSKKTVDEFHDKFRNIDILLIDDIQFIIGKESTQEEFFHTFNHLHTAGKQIIISSDKPPKDIETLEARLRTRFEWGLIADISSPDYETRMAILQKKIELDNLQKYNIPDDVLTYIASNIKTNIRELESSLNKLIALYKLNNNEGEIDISLAAEALKDLISSNNARKVTPELILDIVAEHYNITIADLKSNKRSADIANPRQVAMYLIRTLSEKEYSLKAIGILLGGKDHSTVKYGIEKIEDEIKTDETLANTINIIKKKINPV